MYGANYRPWSGVPRRHDREKFGFGSASVRGSSGVRKATTHVRDAEHAWCTFVAPSERLTYPSAPPLMRSVPNVPLNEHTYSTALASHKSRHDVKLTDWGRVEARTASGSGNHGRFSSPCPAVDGIQYQPQIAAPSRPSSATVHLARPAPTTRPCSSGSMRSAWKMPFAPTVESHANTQPFLVSDAEAQRDSFRRYQAIGTGDNVMMLRREGGADSGAASRPLSYRPLLTAVHQSFNARISENPAHVPLAK